MKIQLIALALLFITCTPKPSILDVGIPLEMAKYRKKQVAEVFYDLSFNVPEKLEDPVSSVLKLTLKVRDLDYPVYLDFNEQKEKIHSVIVNEVKIDIDHRQEHLVIDASHLKKGSNTVTIDFIAGELSLNRNEDFLYTLLVPDRASTLFPCFDQPDIKGKYQLAISAPTNWKVLCGAPLQSKSEKEAFTEHKFGISDKMSTYLFSFVAGRFESAQIVKEKLPMNLLYRETDPDKVDLSIPKIFKHHEEAVEFLESYTDFPFPFQKLDYAAIPGFQYGGMEHVGAIQYRESALFLDSSATQSRNLGRAKLIAHETAHMWFGDLVTIRWFDDVWMKEVFANFMADKIVNPAFPDINHDLQFVTTHYPSAYSEDRTKGTNPIKQSLDNLKNAGTMYGRIIYNKAPIMMRQLEAAMGKTAFQEGITEYIATYQNENADWNELVSILDEKTSQDLRSWSKVWVNQSGRPVITDEVSYDEPGSISTFMVSQHAEDGSDKLWPQSFEIGLVYEDTVVRVPIELTGGNLEVLAAIGMKRPEAIVYNYNGFGYGVFPASEKSFLSTPELKDEVARGYSYINSYENVLAGSLSPGVALSIYQRALEREENELIVRLLVSQYKNLFWKFISADQRKALQPVVEQLIYELLQNEKPDNIKKTLFGLYRSLAYSDRGKERLYSIWNEQTAIVGLNLNENDFEQVAMDLAIYGHQNSTSILGSTLEGYENPDKKERFQFLLPSLSDKPDVRSKFFNSLGLAENREKEAWVLTAINNIHHPLRQRQSIVLLPSSLDWLSEIQRTGDIFFPKRWLVNTVGNYSSPEALKIVENFVDTHPNLNNALKNKLLQSVDDLYRSQEIKTSIL